jgi:hypothetical protein
MLLLALVLACAPAPSGAPASAPAKPASPSDPLLAAMAGKPLVETHHGSCRMACRHIDRDEVEDVLRTGRIDPSRTRNDGSCPSHAVEGTTDDGQRVRVVFAACDDVTKVVTAIDLGRDWPCDCP